MPAEPLSLPQDDSPAAPFLFSDETIKELTDLEERGIYTAARCPADKKRAIITLLKEGRSFREVAGLVTKVKEETVKAVYDAHALEIDQARQMSSKILPKARYALNLQLDRLIEHPGSVPFASTGILVKQLYDMIALEEGKPTERTEETSTRNVFAQFQILVAELKNKKAGPPEEIGAEKMGFGGGKVPLIHGGPTLEAELLDPAPADNKSEDPGTDSQGDALQVATCVTEPAPIAPLQVQTSGSQEGPPRGGDRPAERPASTSTGNATRNFSANESTPTL